jgi:hypothetical protein
MDLMRDFCERRAPISRNPSPFVISNGVTPPAVEEAVADAPEKEAPLSRADEAGWSP